MKSHRLKLFGFSSLNGFMKKNAEKARIIAEMRAAEIARRVRAETELRQKRERQRLELEMVFCGTFKKPVLTGWRKILISVSVYR